MTPLPAPGSRVYYAFGAASAFSSGSTSLGSGARGGAGDDKDAVSEVFSFVSPRKPGDATSFTFLVTADAGIGAISKEEMGGATHNDPPANGADAVAAAMMRDQLPTDEFLILNGDISYARY